jgi:peptidyl-prolyl cis-trans isomerase B (cyclophilin B)
MKRSNRIMIALLAALLVMAAALAGCGGGSGTDAAQSAEGTEDKEMAGDKPVVEITMQGGGKIDIELDPSAAPITVENFLKLVNEGFYDGLTFHRIIKGFMIQGGDPLGNGTGGSDETIKGEFESNGVDNPISHVRGVISMARSQSPDSASSQFFITNADAFNLDGEYAAFGTVISGMDVVDQISETPVIDNNGTVEKANQPVIESIKQIQ